MKAFLGCDPSWKELGLSIIDPDNKVLYTTSHEFDYNSKQPYYVRQFSKPVVNYVREYIIERIGPVDLHVGIEYHSTYGAYMQGELLVLDNMILSELDDMCAETNLYYQTYLSYVTGHKSSEKRLTAFWVMDIIKIFEANGYYINWDNVIIQKSKKYGDHITGGEADSFVYALRQFIKHKDILDEKDQNIINIITEKFPKFLVDKEVI